MGCDGSNGSNGFDSMQYHKKRIGRLIEWVWFFLGYEGMVEGRRRGSRGVQYARRRSLREYWRLPSRG